MPAEEKKYGAKLRYRQEDQVCTMKKTSEPSIGNSNFLLSFEVSQRAITPGQIAVIYDGDNVVGSGIIIE
jgi:tRNA-specific 2-thiouridylase